MTRAQLKAAAKEQIKGKIGILFVIMLVIAIVSGVASIVPVVGSIAASSVFALSIVNIYLGITKGKDVEIKDAFSGIDDLFSSFKVLFLTGLFTALWSLLFYIPGIVKGIAYSQAMFILSENPKMSAREALKRSQEMMKGHKMEFFVLQLSFILWYILGGLTFGIAYIYIIPYVMATNANFYNSIKPVEGYEVPVVE